ncbi:MAG: hypothetical protein KBB11_04240 [Bacteroidales bacterium]|nr:hypothetical protein [Bacteroidales bacterium]HOY38712.1 hypothetical protein [Bacteroidales bacterium]HQP05264.1 hypothetical protein [Bacteroidales bacterium]
MAKEREIDLVELYIKIVSFLKRRYLLLIIITVIGVGLGLARHFTAPPRYRVIMIASSEILDKQYVYALASPMSMYVEQRKYVDLSNYLGCDVKALSAVKALELDSTLLNSVKLEMIFSDSSSIKAFRDAVINFYNKQKFIVAYYENEKKNLNDFVKTIDSEIAELNEFQAKMLNQENSKNNIEIYTSIAGSHEEMITLYEKRYELRGKMMQTQPISFINDGLVMEKNNSIALGLLIWGGVFFILALITGIYLDLKLAARNRRNSKLV